MTLKNARLLNEEIAKTYELFGLEISFTEFKDIFTLGAIYGEALAKTEQQPETTNGENIVWERIPVKNKKNWLAKR